jgi:hypothetical protein
VCMYTAYQAPQVARSEIFRSKSYPKKTTM